MADGRSMVEVEIFDNLCTLEVIQNFCYLFFTHPHIWLPPWMGACPFCMGAGPLFYFAAFFFLILLFVYLFFTVVCIVYNTIL